MTRPVRIAVLFFTSGSIWFASFFVWFMLSQAQTVLADPAVQSRKFLDAFTTPPLPRVNGNFSLLATAAYDIALVAVAVFLFLSDKLPGGWIRKGIAFGVVYWALMVPWFEFYLPFNAMHEPIRLALL